MWVGIPCSIGSNYLFLNIGENVLVVFVSVSALLRIVRH